MPWEGDLLSHPVLQTSMSAPCRRTTACRGRRASIQEGASSASARSARSLVATSPM